MSPLQKALIDISIPCGLVALFYAFVGYFNYRALKKLRKPGKKYPSAVIREIDRLLEP